MLVQIPLLADPITRVTVSYPPDTVETIDVLKGTAEVEVDLPEGMVESLVNVTVVGVGNSGRPVGEPQTVKYATGTTPGLDGLDGPDGPDGPDGDPGPPGSDDDSVKTEEEPADAGKSEINLAGEVTSTIERAEKPEFVMPDSAPLSSSLQLDDTREIISPFNGSDVVKHDGPFPNGPQKLGL